jgi:hypothetical protein
MAKYTIKRGFRAPTLFDDSMPNTATYDVYRRNFLSRMQHIRTFDTRTEAEDWIKVQKD